MNHFIIHILIGDSVIPLYLVERAGDQRGEAPNGAGTTYSLPHGPLTDLLHHRIYGHPSSIGNNITY